MLFPILLGHVERVVYVPDHLVRQLNTTDEGGMIGKIACCGAVQSATYSIPVWTSFGQLTPGIESWTQPLQCLSRGIHFEI